MSNTTDVRAQLAALVARYDNNETGMVRDAIAAAEARRPAYWRTTNYSQAVTALVVAYANLDSLPAALAQWVDDRHDAEKRRAEVLSHLIPVNAAAKAELARATGGAGLREAA